MKRLLIVATFLCVTCQLFACTCDGYPKIKEGYEESDLIFKGKVISSERIITIDTLGFINGDLFTVKYKRTKYLFEVDKLIKGEIQSDTLQITTTGDESNCGYVFNTGKKYIVYSNISMQKLRYDLRFHKITPFYTSYLCSRTKRSSLKTLWELNRLKRIAKKRRKPVTKATASADS